jgi:hypothetical protein
MQIDDYYYWQVITYGNIRLIFFILLVPKLCLGTHLLGSQAQLGNQIKLANSNPQPLPRNP